MTPISHIASSNRNHRHRNSSAPVARHSFTQNRNSIVSSQTTQTQSQTPIQTQINNLRQRLENHGFHRHIIRKRILSNNSSIATLSQINTENQANSEVTMSQNGMFMCIYL